LKLCNDFEVGVTRISDHHGGLPRFHLDVLARHWRRSERFV